MDKMLDGIHAFQIRWSELHAAYPTSPLEKTKICLAMAQLAGDPTAVQGIALTLREGLRPLFRELADAYLNGQSLSTAASVYAEPTPPQQRRHQCNRPDLKSAVSRRVDDYSVEILR